MSKFRIQKTFFSMADLIDENSDGSVNWNYWMAISGWRPFEIACLLLEVDPDFVSRNNSAERDEVLTRIRRIEHILRRAVEMKQLMDPEEQHNVLVWLINNEIMPPTQIVTYMKKYKIANYKKMLEEKELENKELVEKIKQIDIDEVDSRKLKSFYRIIYTVARKHYHLDNQALHSVATNIASALELDGLNTPKIGAIVNILKAAKQTVLKNVKG